jgi:hypothetical protein
MNERQLRGRREDSWLDFEPAGRQLGARSQRIPYARQLRL